LNQGCSQFKDPAMAGIPSSNLGNSEPLDEPSIDTEGTSSSSTKANVTGNHVDKDQVMADAPSDPLMPPNPSTSELVCYQQMSSSQNREGHPVEIQSMSADPSNEISSSVQCTPQRMNWNIIQNKQRCKRAKSRIQLTRLSFVSVTMCH